MLFSVFFNVRGWLTHFSTVGFRVMLELFFEAYMNKKKGRERIG